MLSAEVGESVRSPVIIKSPGDAPGESVPGEVSMPTAIVPLPLIVPELVRVWPAGTVRVDRSPTVSAPELDRSPTAVKLRPFANVRSPSLDASGAIASNRAFDPFRRTV